MLAKKRIGIDCRLAGLRHAGIGRYIENLICNLVLDASIEWIFYFRDKQQFNEIAHRNPHIKKAKLRFVDIQHYTISEQIKLPSIFYADNLDLLHIPHFNIPIFYNKKIIVTIYDLLWHQQKGNQVTTLSPLQYRVKYWGYKFITHKAVKKSKKILTIANTTKQTLIKLIPESKNKIKVTYCGINKYFMNFKYKQKKYNKTIVYIGSLYPHKNVDLVFEALKYLPEHRLIIIGSRDVFVQKTKQRVKQLNLTDQVEFKGYLTDKQLIQTLLHSSALIQPSKSEGFGLTGVEALALGVPLLASDIEIFQEIYQKYPIYFDPESVQSLVKAINNLQTNFLQIKKQVAEAKKFLQKYNWQTMSDQTLQTYKSILNEN